MAKKGKAMRPQRGAAVMTAGRPPPSTARLFMTVALLALIPFSLPTMLLMFAGMLPTLVAALTDRTSSRYAWICVGGLNFAGLCPAVLSHGQHAHAVLHREATEKRTNKTISIEYKKEMAIAE